jgi:hypothetical protein
MVKMSSKSMASHLERRVLRDPCAIVELTHPLFDVEQACGEVARVSSQACATGIYKFSPSESNICPWGALHNLIIKLQFVSKSSPTSGTGFIRSLKTVNVKIRVLLEIMLELNIRPLAPFSITFGLANPHRKSAPI